MSDSNCDQPHPSIARIERGHVGEIAVYLDGVAEPINNVRIARCFPWSAPDGHVSIRDADGKEICLLKTLDQLDESSREIVDAELSEKVFNPQIKQVVDFTHEFGVTTITAETDRGRVSFQVRGRDDVRLLSPTRALFRDVDGNTYELPDLLALDGVSRKYLQAYF